MVYITYVLHETRAGKQGRVRLLEKDTSCESLWPSTFYILHAIFIYDLCMVGFVAEFLREHSLLHTTGQQSPQCFAQDIGYVKLCNA